MLIIARESSRTSASAGVTRQEQVRRPAVHHDEKPEQEVAPEAPREPVNAGRATTWTRWA
jgi:hypothetical protein